MLRMFKKLMSVILIMSSLYAPALLADPTLLLQSSLPLWASGQSVMTNGQTIYLYYTLSNSTNADITNITVSNSIPAGCTVTIPAGGVPAGTTYTAAVPGGAPGTWSVPTLAATSSKQLILKVVYSGATGITIVPSATITSGGTGTSLVSINVVANTVLVEASKTVMGNNEINSIYITATNSTNADISNAVISVSIPSVVSGVNTQFLANPITATVPSGTTYTAPVNPSQIGTWTIPTLAKNSSKQLVLKVKYTGASGKIVTPSATYTSGQVGSSSIDILVGCPFLSWSSSNTPVTLNNGNDVNFSSAGTTTYMVNLRNAPLSPVSPTNPAVVFNGRLQDLDAGSTAYTARFQNSTSGANSSIAPVLTLQNAYTPGNSGNAPYQMVFANQALGFLNPAAPVTSNPPNYLEGRFTFDSTVYPNGLNGISFFIYDIDANPTNGWQDAIIVFGTDLSNNLVAPITQYSVISTVFNVPTPGGYVVNIGGNLPSATYTNNLVGYSEDDPRGRVTYLFPSAIKDFTIRYFRNSQINSTHYVWLSNLYRGCGSDLQLSLEAPDNTDCDICFTYTLVAHNAGPSDVGHAQVTGVVPAGIANVQSYVASKGMLDPVTGIWSFDSFKNNDTETLVVTGCAGTDSLISFSMVLTGDGDQTVPGNNIATHDTDVTYIVVQDDTAITGQGIPVVVNWAANDSSVGGTVNLNSFNFTPPSVTEGVVTNHPGTGTITFTPNPSFIGTASIPYTVSDSNDCTGNGTIRVIINGAPIATDKHATTIPATLVTTNVAAGDTYAIGSTFALDTPPSHGVATVSSDGLVSDYTPTGTFCGDDSYTYEITQPDNQTATATVYVHVICPPIAVDNSAVTAPGVPVNINIAANDTFINPSTFALVTPAAHGTAIVNTNGTSVYTPDADFCGTDTYTYNITQQPATSYQQLSNTATVTVTVPCGTPPQAFNDSATTLVNTPVTIPVLLNDVAGSYPLNPSSVQVVTNPSHGTITNINVSTGDITYKPNPFYTGTDSFVYTVCDTAAAPQCTTAMVYITVNPLYKPCPTVCSTDCCANPCFQEINECMCNALSFAQFASVTGSWSQVGSVVTTTANVGNFNFLRYKPQVSQSNEVLEVKLQFPAGQLTEQYVSAGIITNWDGTTQDTSKVAYLSFDNRSGVPVGSKLAIGGLNATETIIALPFQINIGQTYTLRLEKSLQLTNVYIDNVYIGSSTAGIVSGNYIGVWSYQAKVNFSDLTSCSYPLTPPNFVIPS